MRVKKIAVRCRLDRNGCITSSYLILPPTKPAVGKSFTAQASRLGVCFFINGFVFYKTSGPGIVHPLIAGIKLLLIVS